MIAEWVLVLTLVAGGYSSPAVTSVGGFKTEAACLTAANHWLKQVKSVEVTQHSPTRWATAMCAKNYQ